MNWHGRTELGHDSRWHPPLPTKGTGPSQTHSPRGDQSPVCGLTFWPCMPSGPRGPTLPEGPGGPGAPSLPRGPGTPIIPGAPCRRAEGEAGGVRADAMDIL